MAFCRELRIRRASDSFLKAHGIVEDYGLDDVEAGTPRSAPLGIPAKQYKQNRGNKIAELPAELLQMAGHLKEDDLAKETAKLLALEFFREDNISLGRAAELCHTPIEAFMEFAVEHEVSFHYGIAELEEDRRTIAKLRL